MQDITFLKNKKIGILGMARTGISCYLALKNSNNNVIIWDDNLSNKQSNSHESIQIKDIISPDNNKWSEIDLMIVSPGIPTNFPHCHPLIALQKKRNIKFVCDIEILYKENSLADYIAITGTNGKSTTTSLIGHIFKNSGIKSQIGGNIGIASLELDKLQSQQSYILELSSFQLEVLDEFKANIAILLNITADHLDRYKNMEDYIDTKCRIFNNQSKNDIAIINIDNEICRAITTRLPNNKIIPFSVESKLDYGAYIQDNQLFINIEKLNDNFEIPYNLSLIGKHNQQNILAVTIACYLRNIPKEAIIESLVNFTGLPHRMEYLGKVNNINFINDSKATNIDACLTALASFDNIIWIAGGYIKSSEDFSKISPFFKKIKKAYFIGQSANELYEFFHDKFDCEIVNNIENAFQSSVKFSTTGDNILLAPGYASLDQFKNFEDRGNQFKKLFQKLLL